MLGGVFRVSQRLGRLEPANRLSRRFGQLLAAGAEVIDLADTNPTHWGLANGPALDALAREVAAHRPYDPDPRGPVAARQALAVRMGGHPDDYLLAAGTSELYGWLFALLCDPGDRIAVPRPGYPLFDALARIHDVEVVTYDLGYAHPGGWRADPDQLAGLVRLPRMRAVVVVAPGNPTGSYLRPAEREALVTAAGAAGVPIIADEVFRPYPLDAAPVPDPLAGQTCCPTFALGGASKVLCLPQAKVSWMRVSGVTGSERAELWRRLELVADTDLCLCGPVGAALPAMLASADAGIARTRARLAANLAAARRVFGGVGSPYRVRRCDGGWTALVEVPRPVDDEALAYALLDRGHVRAFPGYFYDSDETGLLALSLLLDPDVFAAGCGRVRAVIDAL